MNHPALLLTGDDRYRDEALRQIECVFDDTIWPIWRDLSHSWVTADLRTGQFMRAIGPAYDWLYPSLSTKRRQWIVDGLDRKGIQPYLTSLEEKAFWAIAQDRNPITG